MLPHVSLLTEASSAYVARVWFLPGVYLDVIVQSFCPSKGLLAVVALVSTIASMYQSVLIEDGASEESLVADIALERPLPRVLLPRVIREVRLDRETLIAVLAGVWFHAHVESLVGPHMTRLGITLAANIANVRSQPIVPPLVRVERVCRGQQAAADVAGEFRTLLSSVIPYSFTVVEYVAAELAYVLCVARLGQSGRVAVPFSLVLIQQS